MPNAGSLGKGKRRIMRALKINEISGVDVPAQEGATALIMKRKDGKAPDDRNSQTEELAKGATLTTATNGHTHLLNPDNYDGGEANSGFTTWTEDHMHPWIRMEDGSILIGEADGHTHEIGAVGKSATDDAEDDDPGNRVNKELDMPKENAQPTVEDLQKQLARVSAIAGMNDAEKSFMGALDEAGQDAFVAKSAADRKAQMDEAERLAKAAEEEANKADPVVYKTADGIEIRKSDGATVLALAKSNDELRKSNASLQASNESASLEKRAETELSHIPGSLEVRVAMLKSVESIADENLRKDALAGLHAQNDLMKSAFVSKGHTNAQVVAGSPEDELDQLAKAHHAQNPDMTFEQAYDAVTRTAKGATLYAKTIN